MPPIFGLLRRAYRTGTISACTRLRQAFLQEGRDVILDFSRTTRIFPDGMLLFVAELDRAIRLGRPDQVVRCKLPEGDGNDARIVREVLEQIGLLRRIQHPVAIKPVAGEFDESVRHWRYATGTRVDEEPGDVLEEHEGRIAPGLMKSMQIGLTEALLNSLHHAYRGDREDGCRRSPERRWWMFTHEKDGMLSVMVCDLGIGIPRSLPLTWDKYFLKRLSTYFPGSLPEVTSIRMALVLGESSTGEDHRGRGLPQIWNAPQGAEQGSVGIFSGHAYLGYNKETGESQSQYNDSILGTLISWTLPIEASEGTDE